MEAIVDIDTLLHSKIRLDRDEGLAMLNKVLESKERDHVAKNLLIKFHKELLMTNDSTEWEVIYGCMLGAKSVFNAFVGSTNIRVVISDANFFQEFSLKCLQHDEVRVRTEGGELLGVLCKLLGSKVYDECEDGVLTLLKADLERHIEADVGSEEHRPQTQQLQQRQESSVHSQILQNMKVNIFHESAGWRFLETTMKCLKCMIDGCGASFNPYITQNLLDLLFSAFTHTNRFVRETGFNVCAAIVACGSGNGNSVKKYGPQFALHLAKGLADNWSQVRLASSVATRNFLLSFKNPDDSQLYYGKLIPRLCLNRYYIAEGVRIYSQETWRLIVGDQGKDIVEMYVAEIAAYYIEATKADNHAVREAACACISELSHKISPQVVEHLVLELLDALLECFVDDSWPVRDAACVACGNFVLNFPEKSESKRQQMYQLFLGNLKDPIPSVREGAGAALAKYVKAYGKTVFSAVVKEIEAGLEDVKNQPENATKFIGLDKRAVQFGVAKNLHSDTDKEHTDQQMYSCGSLAPKMGRGSQGGCSDARFRRPSEPWERSDGTVYWISELCQYFPTQSSQMLPSIVKALTYKHFPQHLIFLETVCRQLPKVATRIGKRAFKMHLEIFIDSIFEAVTCDVQLTIAAGEDCLFQLGKFIGTGILRGRITNYNDRYLETFDCLMHRTTKPAEPFKFQVANPE